MDNFNENIFSIREGELYIEELKASELAQRFGTPLMVYSETLIRDRFIEIRREFLEKYKGASAAYAGKAFLTPAMCRIVDEEGFHLDVVSAGELFTAKRANFPPEKISYHGNNKTYEELDEAISSGVGRIIVDGLDELTIVEELAEKHGRQQAVLFRITPEVKAGAHSHITTGNRDSKFGIPLDKEIIYPLIKNAIMSSFIELKGFHFHIGSQIFDFAPFLEATKKTLEVVVNVYKHFDYAITELVIGGGYGIRYTDAEERKPYSFFMDPIMEEMGEFCAVHGISPLHVGIEPGRSIVGNAGTTLYKIGAIKRIPGGTHFVSIDGGMSDNIRPALYDAKYEAIIANKAADSLTEKVTICGKLCESGDRIIEDLEIANPERGDILCVFSTGAYGYSMASNYNKMPKPAVVLVKGNKAELIVRRQSLEEMTQGEL